MINIQTELISGAGNTFHIAYAQSQLFLKEKNAHALMQQAAVEICKKTPADGFILLEQLSVQNFKWYFFNNDGSDAEMCGNATCCVGFYIQNHLKQSSSYWTLHTVAGPIDISPLGSNQFRVQMSPIQKLKSSLGFFCDTGVPHLVLEFSQKNLFQNLNENLKNQSKKLRFHPEHQPRGTNVTHVEFLDNPNYVKAVSYERGVENFTQACGTGAMAAAFFNLAAHGISETTVEMPGGTLIMNLSNPDQPVMIGSAVALGSYQYEIEL